MTQQPQIQFGISIDPSTSNMEESYQRALFADP
jgi:hypothetical protein